MNIFRRCFGKKVNLGVFGCLFLALFLLSPDIAFAIDGNNTSAVTAGTNEFTNAFASILAVFVNLVTFLSLVMVSWGGQLMGTEMLTNETIVKALLPMWQLIRNFTNISFVVILIFLAGANIVSSFTGQGGWTIKEKLPRIILAMVAINFSFLGMTLLIDAVHVGTTAILSIADNALVEIKGNQIAEILSTPVSNDGTPGGIQECKSGDDCKPFYELMNKAMCPNNNWKDNDKCHFCLNINGACKVGKGITIESKPSPETRSSGTARNLFMAFSVHFIQLEKLVLIPSQLGNANPLAIIQNFSFSMFMGVMYLLVLAAVFIALIFRVVILWLAIIFSPAMLAINIMGIGGSFSELNKKFVTNLIMPLKVAAAFSISFVLIVALSSFEHELQLENSVNGEALFVMGPIYRQYFVNEYGVLWQIMTIVVFWMAAWWALEGSSADFIIKNIKEGAQKTGKFAASAAVMDRQIIPSFFGERKAMSMNALKGLPTAFENQWNAKMKERDRTGYEDIFAQAGIGDKDLLEASKTLNASGLKFESMTNDLQRLGEIGPTLQKIGADTAKLKIDEVEAYIKKAGLTEAGLEDKLIKLAKARDHEGLNTLINKKNLNAPDVNIQKAGSDASGGDGDTTIETTSNYSVDKNKVFDGGVEVVDFTKLNGQKSVEDLNKYIDQNVQDKNSQVAISNELNGFLKKNLKDYDPDKNIYTLKDGEIMVEKKNDKKD